MRPRPVCPRPVRPRPVARRPAGAPAAGAPAAGAPAAGAPLVAADAGAEPPGLVPVPAGAELPGWAASAAAVEPPTRVGSSPICRTDTGLAVVGDRIVATGARTCGGIGLACRFGLPLGSGPFGGGLVGPVGSDVGLPLLRLGGLGACGLPPRLGAARLGGHAGPVGDVAARRDVRGRRAQFVPLLGRGRRLLVRPGDVDHWAHGAQRPRGQPLDEVVRVLVDGGDGAAVRPGLERPQGPVVRAARAPGQRDDPASVVALPRVPFARVVLLAAQAEGVCDDVAQHAVVRPVGAHGVGPLGDFGRARPLQQHGIGEPLDLLCGHTGGRCDLVHGRSGTNAGLDLTWAQLALQLDRDLAEPGEIPAGSRAQLLIRGHGEPLLAHGILEHDGEFPAALADPDNPQRPHARPPALLHTPRQGDGRCTTATCRGGAPDPKMQVRRAKSAACTQSARLITLGKIEADVTRVTTVRDGGQPSRSTTQSMQAVRAATSSGSTAGNIPTRSWLRPSLR